MTEPSGIHDIRAAEAAPSGGTPATRLQRRRFIGLPEAVHFAYPPAHPEAYLTMSNPYVTPPASSTQGGLADSAAASGHSPAVQQIPIFAILMMIHGGLTLAVGLLFGTLAGVMPFFIQTTMQNQPGGQVPPGPQPPIWLFSLMYGLPAGVALISGGLQLWGGWRAYHFRSRTLAFVGAVSAFATVLTCYCGFTGVAVGVYGLILLLDSGVAEAFSMGAAGHHREEILSRFARVVYRQPPPAAH